MNLSEFVEKNFLTPDGDYRWVIASGHNLLMVIKKDNNGLELARWEFKMNSLPQVKPVERAEERVEKKDLSDVVVADTTSAFLRGFICGLSHNPEAEDPDTSRMVLQ